MKSLNDESFEEGMKKQEKQFEISQIRNVNDIQDDETVRSIAFNDNDMSLRPLQENHQEELPAIRRRRSSKGSRGLAYQSDSRGQTVNHANDFEIVQSS